MKIVCYDAYTDRYLIRYDNGAELWIPADQIGDI